MKFTKETAVARACQDLAARLSVDPATISAKVESVEFSNMSLGAPAHGENAAQMLVSGWRISLNVGGKSYEYRADKYQLRLFGFNGSNHLIEG